MSRVMVSPDTLPTPRNARRLPSEKVASVIATAEPPAGALFWKLRPPTDTVHDACGVPGVRKSTPPKNAPRLGEVRMKELSALMPSWRLLPVSVVWPVGVVGMDCALKPSYSALLGT